MAQRGRPRAPIGTVGKVSITGSAEIGYRARARLRLVDGRSHPVESTGRTKAAAERALRERIRLRVATSGSDDLHGGTTVTELLDRWMASRAGDLSLSAQSRDEYRRCITASIVPAMGELRLEELHPGLIDQHLQAMAATTPGRARQARTILRQACRYAVSHRVWPVSPVQDLTPLPGRKKRAAKLTSEGLTMLRDLIAVWERGDPRRSPDIGRIIDLGLATGCRIGEILALRWEDIDLTSTPSTVFVCGTVVYVKGEGHFRQPHRKGGAPSVRLLLPNWATALLRAQRERVPSDVAWVFPSRELTMRTPNNLRRSLRQALDTSVLAGTTPHTMRSTVASWIRDLADVETASGQLGHGDTSVTEAYYIERSVEAPDATAVLDRLGPSTAGLDDTSPPVAESTTADSVDE